MRPDGFALVSDVLKCKNLTQATVADLERIVGSNDKQRFSFAEIDGKRYIRANQGHSLATVSDLETKPIKTVADLPSGSFFQACISTFQLLFPNYVCFSSSFWYSNPPNRRPISIFSPL